MDSKSELAIPEPQKPELQKDKLLNSLTHAIGAIGNSGAKQIVGKLFFNGGFLFETGKFGIQNPNVEGLVCATDGDHTYKVGVYGEKDPMVTLDVRDKEGKEIAHLTLSPPPNIRPDLWNRWENSSRQMTDEERLELLGKFARAKLDPKTTRKEAVTEMWKTLIGRSWSDLPGFLGNLRTMGQAWGDFVDARNNVLHPLSPPRDVIYNYELPEEQADLLDEPDIGNLSLRRQVQRSVSQRDGELFRIATLFEGVTGHQVITFQSMNFEMLPTKRGLEIFSKLKTAIPVMTSTLAEEELTIIFEGIGDESLTWNFVDPHLREGIQDGFFRQLDYISPEEKTESRDEIDQEFTQRANEARRFRFLAQVLAQKIKTGIKWRLVREKSGALQQLATLENKSVDEIVRKYGV